MNDRQLKNTVIGFALGVSGFSLAAVSLPSTFTAGTPIVAAQVNANFSALKIALETASGIDDGAIGASKLKVTGAAADGKVLKFSGGNLSWADDLTGGGGAAYTAGAGLALAANTFSVNFAGSGSANTVSRSDHDHFGQTWSGASGRGLTVSLPVLTVRAGGQAGLVGRVGNESPFEIVSGVWGDSTDYVGVFGSSKNDVGVYGRSETEYGVYGRSETGEGVYGRSETAVGVFGFSRNGNGVYGDSSTGTGVIASSTGTGTALEIRGPIKVTGARSPAFVHTVGAAVRVSCFNHPLTTNQPNAILIVTQNIGTTSAPVYNNQPVGVIYNTTSGSAFFNRWCISSQDTAGMLTAGSKFNVLVLSQ